MDDLSAPRDMTLFVEAQEKRVHATPAGVEARETHWRREARPRGGVNVCPILVGGLAEASGIGIAMRIRRTEGGTKRSRRGLREATYNRRAGPGGPVAASTRPPTTGGRDQAVPSRPPRGHLQPEGGTKRSRRGLREATYNRRAGPSGPVAASARPPTTGGRDRAVPSRPPRGHLQPEAGPGGPVAAFPQSRDRLQPDAEPSKIGVSNCL